MGAVWAVRTSEAAWGTGSGAHSNPVLGRPEPPVRHCRQCAGCGAVPESLPSLAWAVAPVAAMALTAVSAEWLGSARHTSGAGDTPKER
jgi:hypothetical protein